MSRQRIRSNATLVALVIVVLACSWFFYTSLVQPAIGDTGGSLAGEDTTSDAGSQAGAIGTTDDAGPVPSMTTEQVGLNWWWFLLLLLIPLTGFVIYYYQVVKD
jgi:hypothetical protein